MKETLASPEPSTHHRTIIMPRRARGTSVATATPDRPYLVGARPGAWLGPYQLSLELGSGGMAAVYLARDDRRAGGHRFVALKCLRAELAKEPRCVEMFLDEARLASQIRHANVCSVIDYGEQHGQSYLVMEYLIGETLASIRKQTAAQSDAFPPAQRAAIVARIIADACEGLHAVHELKDANGDPANVVHRDISPENLMLKYDGCVQVLDFGIALSPQQRERTRSGVLKGKYSYIQPEVLKGHTADRRSDLWGMGVVLWELLTGKRLFDFDNDVDTLRAVTQMKIAAPSQAREGVPPELDAITLKALQRDPAKRYQSARELGRQLTNFLAEQRLAIGLAELAEFMDRLFPNGRACKQQLISTVERIDRTAESVEIPISEDLHTVARDPSAELLGSSPDQALPPRRSLTAGLLIAASLLLAALLGLAVTWSRRPAVAPVPSALPAAAPPATEIQAAAAATSPPRSLPPHRPQRRSRPQPPRPRRRPATGWT
jgi:eukaryotic-like serine/threonine-protein kinase